MKIKKKNNLQEKKIANQQRDRSMKLSQMNKNGKRKE